MGTDVALECASHTPPIPSDDIARDNKLSEIFQAIKDRESILRTMLEGEKLGFEMDSRPDDIVWRCARFFRYHPTCDIVVRDEYGKLRTENEPTGEIAKAQDKIRMVHAITAKALPFMQENPEGHLDLNYETAQDLGTQGCMELGLAMAEAGRSCYRFVEWDRSGGRFIWKPMRVVEETNRYWSTDYDL